MNQTIRQIKNRMGAKESSDIFANMAYSLMANFNMSLKEVRNLPIPMALALINRLKEDQKQADKMVK